MRSSAEILKGSNIRPSITRVMIFDYLRERRTHPTVEEIYLSLSPQLPTLSKTTVYNTVKLFSSAGIVKTVTIEEQQARYDACTDLHGHFLCTGCGKVYDFDTLPPERALPQGFEVSTEDVYCTGTCSTCKNKK